MITLWCSLGESYVLLYDMSRVGLVVIILYWILYFLLLLQIPEKNEREIKDCEKLLEKHRQSKKTMEEELQTAMAGVR